MTPVETPVQEWLSVLDQLFAEVEGWCQANGWAVARTPCAITESKVGRYETSSLMVRGPAGVVYVEPIARYVTAGDGLVDIYAWPSLRRMTLVRKGDRWHLRTDNGIAWPSGWSETTFRDVVSALTIAA